MNHHFIRPAFNQLLLSLIWIAASASASAQTCTPPEKLQQARSKIEALLLEHEALAGEYINTLQQLSSALKEVNSCKAGNDVVDDIFYTLTLQDHKCNPAVRQYNQLLARSESQKGQVDMTMTRINTMTTLYKIALGNVCRNQ